MADLYLDAFITGGVSTPSNALGVADGTYTTDSGGANWTASWSFEDPPGALAGTQTLTLRVQADSSGGAAPTIDSVDLMENGSLVRTLATSVTVGYPDVDLQYTFDASEISDPNLVEIQLVTTGSGGTPSGRRSVQLDGVHWDAVLALAASDDELEDATADAAVLTGERRVYEDLIESAEVFDIVPFLGAYSEDYYAETYYVLGTSGVVDDLAEDVNATPELITQSRGMVDDLAEDVNASPELVGAHFDATQDTAADTDATVEVNSQVRAASADTAEDVDATPELVAAVHNAVVDRMSTAEGDDSILTEVKETGEVSDDLIEDATADETILVATAASAVDLAEDVDATPELVGAAFAAVVDLAEDVDATLEVVSAVLDAFADTAEDVDATPELVSAVASASVDLAEDVDATRELVSAVASASVDLAEDVDAKDGLVARDDITEEAVAIVTVPSEAVQEDITEWIWPRARVAQAYSDDVEEVRKVEATYRSKLILDIAVDVDAFAELDGEHRDNRTDQTAQADAEALVEATMDALADLEEEAYIGGAVTNAVGSFYNTLVEDVDADDELTQRLVTSVDLAADANGRDDVAGTAWFKAHSFIEEATAAEELLSETIRRPTKDDVAEDATGDVATLSTVLHAVAAYSEDTLAEDELLGNESGEAWVFNTRTLAFSRYVDFEASQVTTVDDEPLAAGARGVMAYSDTRADGYVKTGLSDYGAPQLKRVRHAYITAASRQPLALSTLHGIGDTLQRTTYQVATLDSTVPYTHRLDLARGDQGQFWAFELRAPAGPPTTLLNLRIIPLVTSRRI